MSLAPDPTVTQGGPTQIGSEAGIPAPPQTARAALTALIVLLGALTASYWTTLTELARDWKSSEDYSAGAFVPLVAIYLLWEKRSLLRTQEVRPFWPAALIVLAAEAARYKGLLDLRQSVERYAFVLEVIGLVWWIGGGALFRRVFWILAFLFLMVPLPGRIHNAISNPLQAQATTAANFVLDLAGIVVRREGNILTLNDRVQVGVVEACSGLRMMTTFLIVAAFLALSIRRPAWQKIVLVMSSVPVAIACNVVRVVATAWLLLATDGSRAVEKYFHDFAGYAMMPVAVVLLVGELWLLSKLVVDDRPVPAPGAPR